MSIQKAISTEVLSALGGQGLAGMLNEIIDEIESGSDPGHTHTLAEGASDVTSSADELNILDGVTADKDEINLLDGLTAVSGSDATLITGTKGTASDLAIWNADGDLVDGPTPPSGTIIGTTDTQTLTNKKITKRVVTEASSATPTPNADTTDIHTITALAENAVFGEPTGTPTNGQSIIVRIEDNGAARDLSFNAIYRFSTDLPAPTTTVLGKTMYLGFIYNSTDSKWDCVSQLDNF